MLKKTKLLLSLILLAGGCTREVYLQKVPCAEGECEPCAAVAPAPAPSPCRPGTLECCPEVAAQTQTEIYIIEDIPSPKVTYIHAPCAKTKKKNCRTICREVRVNSPFPLILSQTKRI